MLNSILPHYTESIRCIYIDPPYNNSERYNHYDDDLGHARWIQEITKRLEILSEFLTPDGSIWISIDDQEMHYLKVAADRVFGRSNFVTTIVWQQRKSRENRRVFSNNHEYILVYAKNPSKFKKSRNSIDITTEVKARYKNPDADLRGPWQSVSANVQAGHATPAQFYEVVAPNGKRHSPPNGRCWAHNKDRMNQEIALGNVWFGKDGNGVPRIKRFLADRKDGLTPETMWLAEDVGTNDQAKKHLLQIFPDHPVFDTPKPESLMHRIFQIATDPGDIVLDAYLGSGTSAAVAHKSDRRYLGIEQGEHAVSHCAYRLKQVVKGERGGISSSVGWSGGGGFDFLRSN